MASKLKKVQTLLDEQNGVFKFVKHGIILDICLLQDYTLKSTLWWLLDAGCITWNSMNLSSPKSWIFQHHNIFQQNSLQKEPTKKNTMKSPLKNNKSAPFSNLNSGSWSWNNPAGLGVHPHWARPWHNQNLIHWQELSWPNPPAPNVFDALLGAHSTPTIPGGWADCCHLYISIWMAGSLL